MRVDILGVRGSTPAPGAAFAGVGGHTSCVAVTADRDDAPSLVLDAGTGVRSLQALLGDRPFLGALALTHLHWDHLMGLPFAGAIDRPDAGALVLVPTEGGDPEATLERAFSPPFFPVRLGELRGEHRFGVLEAGVREVGALRLECRWLPHGRGRALGFRVSDDRSTLAYLPDHGPFASATDRPESHPDALALGRDADLLVHDAHFEAGEEPAARLTGHATADYAAALALAAGARSLLLTHHHPERTDDAVERIARRASRPGLEVAAARDGMRVELACGRPGSSNR